MSQMIPAWQVTLEAESPTPSLRNIVRLSLAIIVLGFGGFFTWACIAPLDTAVPAMGQIVVESKRKTVSLLDAGILKELLVKEGQMVRVGQPLFRLDDVQALATLGSLRIERWVAVAKMARLDAEQHGLRDIAYPEEIREAAAEDPAVASIMANERHAFDDRWKAFDGVIAVNNQKILQLKDEIAAYKAQSESMRQRLGYTEQELKGVNELLAKGFTTKTRLYALQRNEAELRGNIGELVARVSESQQAITQAELEIVSTRNLRQQDISKDLGDAQAANADLSEKIRGATDLLDKKLMVSPDDGKVTDIKFFTPGSAIGAGQPILDIVPQHDGMLVEANVRPEDIEHVRPGLPVNIRLTAYKQHKVPVLTGHLVYVSADRQVDQKGDAYFVARAELDPDVPAKLNGIKLYAGMPAEVLIIGGERLAIDYFLSPITDSLHRSLREE